MDIEKLLSVAKGNKEEAAYESSVKRYNTVIPPAKKAPKSTIQSENIRKFLAKKQAEEAAKAEEARKQREQLLALRAQSTKNSKKAKLMAARTKDNDFSKIKLTDDELEARKKVEAELNRKLLYDKKERMKARIELEEKEKLLPRKRKRKSKNASESETMDSLPEESEEVDHKVIKNGFTSNSSIVSQNKPVQKSRPLPPSFSYDQLLKVAEKKQYEPVEVVVKKKGDEKLMTKKERKMMEEEKLRLKRKQERLLMEQSKSKLQKESSVGNNTLERTKKPCVIHIEKEKATKPDTGTFKIPKAPGVKMETENTKINKNSKFITSEKSSKSLPNSNKIIKAPDKVLSNKVVSKEKPSPKISLESTSKTPSKFGSENTLKAQPKVSSESALKAEEPKSIDDNIITAIEKRIQEKLEKEIEAKIAAKFGINLASIKSQPQKPLSSSNVKIKKSDTTLKTEKPICKKTLDNPVVKSKQDDERTMLLKKKLLENKMKSKLPEKKPFHTNPYLDPPRRLLEPQRPIKPKMPVKRRIESDDDDDDDDDDDMSDFIDDGPSQNEENYSKYIQEIFNYDRSRFEDDDEDDIIESSFGEQLLEETKSAKLGFLEDQEEERKEMERRKKKKMKK